METEIILNIGTGYNSGQSQWSVEHIHGLVSGVFSRCSIVSTRPCSWIGSDGKEYAETTVVLRFPWPTCNHWNSVLLDILETVRLELNQDAIAYATGTGLTGLVSAPGLGYDFDESQFLRV